MKSTMLFQILINVLWSVCLYAGQEPDIMQFMDAYRKGVQELKRRQPEQAPALARQLKERLLQIPKDVVDVIIQRKTITTIDEWQERKPMVPFMHAYQLAAQEAVKKLHEGKDEKSVRAWLREVKDELLEIPQQVVDHYINKLAPAAVVTAARPGFEYATYAQLKTT